MNFMTFALFPLAALLSTSATSVSASVHGARQTYSETVLYSFLGTPDGAFAWAGLLFDSTGAL